MKKPAKFPINGPTNGIKTNNAGMGVKIRKSPNAYLK